MKVTTLEGGQRLTHVHPAQACAGRVCPIHNLTDHSMRDFPQHFRADNGLMERICPHGIGHPDPDGLPHLEEMGFECMDIHGCDGCCTGSQFTE